MILITMPTTSAQVEAWFPAYRRHGRPFQVRGWLPTCKRIVKLAGTEEGVLCAPVEKGWQIWLKR